MADAKLNELIQTLKKQGIESGEEEGRRAVEAAAKDAEKIIAEARAEAKEILEKAKSDADQQLHQLQSSLEIAASQFVTSLKKVTEENLLVIPLKQSLRGELKKPDLLKELIRAFVELYAKDPKGAEIRMLLPGDADDELFEHVMGVMIKHYSGNGDGSKIELVMKAKEVEYGFQVDRTDGSVRLDFTDEAFLSLFLDFLTPRFRDLFYKVKVDSGAGK